MSRIQGRFTVLRAEGRKALVPFVTAGDPEPGLTVPLMHGLVQGGADIIELGVPFSDPMADGPVIQRASERALAHHVSLHRVLDMVKEFRRQDWETPVALMGYLNPIEAMGYRAFAQQAREAGVDGVLTVDLPPEEADALTAALREEDLDPIFLVAPTSSSHRIENIARHATGFVYYVSLKGVTGAANLDVASVSDKLEELRRTIQVPIGVGFGIATPEAAARVAKVADAVVVGSALVRRVEALIQEPHRIPEELRGVLAAMRQAMDAG